MPSRHRRRRGGPDPWNLAIAAVLAALAAVVFWPRSSHSSHERPNPGVNEHYQLVLDDPPWVPGTELDRRKSAVVGWLAGHSLLHRVKGRVDAVGAGLARLAVRPCLYSTTWLPQPRAEVQPDGTFEAVLLFDPRYAAPLLARFEVESGGQAVAAYDLIIPPKLVAEGDRS